METSSHYSCVKAQPFKSLVCHLMATHQLPWRVVAVAAGVPSTVVKNMLFKDRPRIRSCDAKALMRLASGRMEQLKGMVADPLIMREGLSRLGSQVPNAARLAGLDEFSARSYLERGFGLANGLQQAWLLAACEARGIDHDDIFESARFDCEDRLVDAA